MAFPYTPAFVAYCQGAPVEEIAAEFKVPVKSLQAKIRQEGWRSLANRMSGCIPADAGLNSDALNRIEANRAKNYETAAKLREHVIEMVIALRAGTLRIKKQFQHKGQIVEYEAEPGPADWLNIATYARIISDMTYRAIGDSQAQGKPGQDASAGALNPPAPPLTIILPSVIARPRFERSVEVECAPVESSGGNPAMPLSLPAPAPPGA
jgi:hypothetical protein